MNKIQPYYFTTDQGTRYVYGHGIELLSQPVFHRVNMRQFIDSLIGQNDYTEDKSIGSSLELCKTAGQLCYHSFGENRSKNSDIAKYLNNIKQQKHGSVFEHANFSFLFYGVSRSLTHELVRHRAGFSYSQTSQRYIDDKNLRFVCRPEIFHDPILLRFFCQDIDQAKRSYERIKEHLDVKFKTDNISATEKRKAANQVARCVLPNQTETQIIVTANIRAWRHFLEMRASQFAEPEIRSLAISVYRIFLNICYDFFSDYTEEELPNIIGNYNENHNYKLSTEYVGV